MNILEAQFRRQFQAEGAGYRFVRDGQEVGFSAEEVETFVEEWARLWLAPWLWGGWLLVGVAAPFLLARNGYDGGAWTLGMLAAMFMVAVLVPVLQKPGQAADARLTGEPEGSGDPWGGPWLAPIGSGIWVCISVDMVVRSGGTDL